MLAIYTRLSREDDESNSLENQLREGKEFASRQDLSYEHYNEGMGISGQADISDRPELERLFKDIRSGKITKVWARHQNRIERSLRTFLDFTDLVQSHNIEVWFAGKQVDFSQSGEYFHSGLMSFVNKYQASLASEQIRKAVAQNFREGKASGNCPFGYKADEKGYMVVDKEAAKIVKRIFSDYNKRIGSTTICDWLNDTGVPTQSKSTDKWTPSTIRYILKNRVYIGERKFRDTHYSIEPIITKSVFNKSQKILEEKGVFIKGRANRDYLLSGLVKCGVCGENFHGRKHSNKAHRTEYVYYRCNSMKYRGKSCGNKAIMQNHLEDFVWHMVVLHGDLGRRVEESLADNSNRENLENNIRITEKKIASLETEWKNIRRQGAKGILTDDELFEEKNRIDRERNKLEKDIVHDMEELSKIINALSTLEFDPTVVSKNEKSRLFQELIKSVTVEYKDSFYHITIDYNLPIEPDTYKIEKDYTGAWKGDHLVGWVGSNLHPAREKRALARIIKSNEQDRLKGIPSQKEKMEKDMSKGFLN
ncbi:recombinase family protein [Flagellimonas meridianipacifica]|uniref:DNA invertase Pin-like site-specific DNA recombinase n=1 Tax=Flagellimonas meridianipacifica TaxID=1080225 RepID=A0A2T0MA53_9FLAO|nr:recombinase family protein [Allomuricauda pacifica]PRX54416.1 DNA invertase Pin-like site-specific DNA recombinase [Allomuricauda pacifica]